MRGKNPASKPPDQRLEVVSENGGEALLSSPTTYSNEEFPANSDTSESSDDEGGVRLDQSSWSPSFN